MTDIVITAAKRTPVGSFLGAFASTPAHELGRIAIEAALAQAGITGDDVSEVILGQVLTAAQGQNPARQASMAAGVPKEIPAWGVNQVCGSGLRAVALAGILLLLWLNLMTLPLLALLRLADGTILSRILVTWTQPVDLFFERAEMRYRRAGDADWTYAPDGLAGTYAAPVEDGATYEIQVRARNSFGVTSDWSTITHVVVGKTEAPPPPLTFLVSRDSDGTRRFTWQPPANPPADLKGYLMRFASGLDVEWDDMVPLHEGVLTNSPYETNAIAAGDKTFAIVSVDTTGNLSEARYIEANLGDPRLAGALEVQQSHEDGWPGTKTNAWIDPTSGWLLATDSKNWSSLATDGLTWATWTQWARSPNTLTYVGEVIDVGLVTRFNPLLAAEYSGSVTLEVRTSNDNSTWSSWAVPTGQVTARYVQARATIAPVSNGFTALKTMTLILDANVISEDIEDLATSSLTGGHRIGTGDIRLPITKTYGLIRKVDVALQNVGAGWSWEVIDKDTSTGPRIKIYNASNTLADATIDATIRGVA